MQAYYSKRTGAQSARVFAAFWAAMVLVIVFSAQPAAAPFAYVTNAGANSVSVIDTAINMVVATIPVGGDPIGVAVTPDGKHAYVANAGPSPPATVSVIDTATNIAVATIQLPGAFFPVAVAVTPDGNYAYVTDNTSYTVSVIATATNTVVATVAVGHIPVGVAVSPDGKHVYVANNANGGSVSVIATATNTVVTTVQTGGINLEGIAITPDGKHVYVATDSISGIQFVSVIDTTTYTVVAQVEVAGFLEGVAITPDGTHAYVTNDNDNNAGTVSVIATASNTVVATVPVGQIPQGVAVTPDGKHAYITNLTSNTVSVIDTATNTVVATVPVGTTPAGVGIIPPPPGVPFLAFSAKLAIAFGTAPNEDTFYLHSQFTLSSTAPGFRLQLKPVTLQVGTFSATIPPASFAKQPDGSFFFEGVINGVSLKARITPTGTLQYVFHAKATGASLTGTKNMVYVTLIIGGDSGATSVSAALAAASATLH